MINLSQFIAIIRRKESQLMKLREPIAVRESLMVRGMPTITQIAERLHLATNTVSRALRGEPVQMRTISVLATAIDSTAADIATVVND